MKDAGERTIALASGRWDCRRASSIPRNDACRPLSLIPGEGSSQLPTSQFCASWSSAEMVKTTPLALTHRRSPSDVSGNSPTGVGSAC